MKQGAMLFAVALAVTGCGGAGAGKAQTSGPQTPGGAAQLPAPTSNQQCDAPALAYLVGHPRTDIPVPVDPSHRRVFCTSCSVTEDYDPQRTNIVFDAKTGLITAVRCG
jgi:hypothetical protein